MALPDNEFNLEPRKDKAQKEGAILAGNAILRIADALETLAFLKETEMLQAAELRKPIVERHVVELTLDDCQYVAVPGKEDEEGP